MDSDRSGVNRQLVLFEDRYVEEYPFLRGSPMWNRMILMWKMYRVESLEPDRE